MAAKNKKTDRDKAWNRRANTALAYKVESLTANDKRFLIICEGENTEPSYFKSFPVITAQVESYGLGRSKTSLVERAIQTLQGPPDAEREVWIVFDMDFDKGKDTAAQRADFNRAVQFAEKQGFRVAYSNDAFELWFVFHYQLQESALTREEYYSLLSKHWTMSYERKGKGTQFCRSIYQRLQDDPKSSQAKAIYFAKMLHQRQSGEVPSDQNPCTTVYLLVDELNKHLRK